MFIKETDGSLRYVQGNLKNVQESLDNKLYNVKVQKTMFGTYYSFLENNIYDKGKVSEAGVFAEVNEYVNSYFSKEGYEVRKEMELPTRLGLLFTGEPGTGKTFLAGQIVKKLREEKNAIAITTTTPSALPLSEIVDMLRGEDKDRLVIMIWDEFEKDYATTGKQGLNQLLTFLDGVESKNNVLVIATCNDISYFPLTMLDRKGRFEKIVEFAIKDEVILDNLVENLIPDKFKDKLSKKSVLEKASKIDNINIDTLKSFVRDALTNILQGKSPFIEEKNNADITKIKENNKKKKKDVLDFKVRVDDLQDQLDSYDFKDTISLNDIKEYHSN